MVSKDGINPNTAKTRKWRENPANREKDRERSRRWKAENIERKRAYDREYSKRRHRAAAAARAAAGASPPLDADVSPETGSNALQIDGPVTALLRDYDGPIKVMSGGTLIILR